MVDTVFMVVLPVKNALSEALPLQRTFRFIEPALCPDAVDPAFLRTYDIHNMNDFLTPVHFLRFRRFGAIFGRMAAGAGMVTAQGRVAIAHAGPLRETFHARSFA